MPNENLNGEEPKLSEDQIDSILSELGLSDVEPASTPPEPPPKSKPTEQQPEPEEKQNEPAKDNAPPTPPAGEPELPPSKPEPQVNENIPRKEDDDAEDTPTVNVNIDTSKLNDIIKEVGLNEKAKTDTPEKEILKEEVADTPDTSEETTSPVESPKQEKVDDIEKITEPDKEPSLFSNETVNSIINEIQTIKGDTKPDSTSIDLNTLGATPFQIEDFQNEENDSQDSTNIELLKNVKLNVKIELGRCKLPIKEVLKLGKGSIVELDKLAGDPLDIYANDKLVAKGEVLVLGDDTFCVRVTEIVSYENE